MIAFASNRGAEWGIYLIRRDGSGLTRLAGGLGLQQAPHPAWSPDGQQIVFEGVYRNTLDIYVVNIDGSGFRRIAATDRNDYFPTWSPDGQWIAFISGGPDSGDVYVIRSDGKGLLKLINHYLQGAPNSSVPGVASSPAWSPDGRYLVYADSPQFPPLDYEIYVVDLAESGGEAKRLIIHSAGADFYPAFSPDGKHLAYSGARDFISKFDLWVTDLRSEPAVITNHRAYTSFPPVWSPDGKWLAYSVIHDGEWEIFRIRSDGSDQQQLTEVPGGEGKDTFTDWGNKNPAWSSDGSQIAFVSNRDRNNEIYVMAADGSGQTNLTNDEADDTNPAWQP